MSFWNTEKLLESQKQLKLINPFDPRRVKHGAYELSFGAEAFITTEGARTKQKFERGQQLAIPSGQFGLLLTEEVITMPNNAIGFISIRASIKFMGLINVSGFHVDPGYRGQLKFAVYNAGSRDITISYGDALFPIWFADLNEATEQPYKNKEDASQYEITSEDVRRLQGEVASPAAIKNQLEDLRSVYDKRLTGLEREVTVLIAIVVGLFLIIIGAFATSLLDTKTKPSSPSAENQRSTESVQNLNRNESTMNNGNSNSAIIPSGNTKLPQER